MGVAGPGLGLQQLDQNHWKPFITPKFDSSTLVVRCLLLDREGTLWIGTNGQGLFRIRGSNVDWLRKTDGLSGDSVGQIYEDKEGNIWVVTRTGLDCLHERRVITYPGPEGVGRDEADGVLASRDGTVWVARAGSLDAIRQDRVTVLKTGDGLPGTQVMGMLEDHADRLWVGIDKSLYVYQEGQLHSILSRDPKSEAMVSSLAEDTENNIWATVRGLSSRALWRIRDSQIQEIFSPPMMPAARLVAADPAGGIWLGLLSGDLARYRGGHLEVFSYPHRGGDPWIRQLTVSPEGLVLASTEDGLLVWDQGKKKVLTSLSGLPCDNVFTHILGSHGTLWLYAECGLIEITEKELQHWLQTPGAKLSTGLVDVSDGVEPGGSPFNGAARTPDGRLWFVNYRALQMMDPSQASANRVVPPVSIEQLTADRKRYSTLNHIHLPPLTRDVQIDYAGLSFTVPEKVRFRYKLDNYDLDWQEPGSRRQAFYSSLPPGTYVFRVTACNNDGLWNYKGASLSFSVDPAWYQTFWFRCFCFAVLFGLTWILYRWRLHQLSHEFNATLEARLVERTRIARELHDTLLQSLHGLMFRFQAARNMLPRRPEEAIGALDGAIARTEQAIAESRDAIKDLRSPAPAESEFAELLTAMGQAMARSTDANQLLPLPIFRVIVEGQARPLVPSIQGEILQISREILTNSFLHAESDQIEAEIRYDRHSLRLRFRDDGKGIDPEILKLGSRPGHWGLPGIRERAQGIQAKLGFWSEHWAGTEIQVTVPATVAYQGLHESSIFKVISRWRNREQ